MGNDVHATGFRTWPAAVLLAQKIAESPKTIFGDKERLRILELGSGTGLVGIVAAKTLLQTSTRAEIMLSDYDLTTLGRLQYNLSVNGCLDLISRVTCRTERLDWSDDINDSYDIILGADLVYEREHGQLLHDAVRRLMVRTGSFHLVAALRPTHSIDIFYLEQLFCPRDRSVSGPRLCIVDTRDHPASVESDTTILRYYRIEWR